MSLSLHDLIYGAGGTNEETKAAAELSPPEQSASAAAADESSLSRPDRKRPPSVDSRQNEKKKRSLDNDASAADTTTDTAVHEDTAQADTEENALALASQRLDVLYSSASLPTASSHKPQSSNDNVASSTQLLLQPPVVVASSTRKTKTHYAKPGRPHSKNTHLQVLASAEQIQERKSKQKRQKEWSKIRENWKKRKYDLRNEVDVGNSVKRTMQQVQQQQATAPQQSAPQQTAPLQPTEKERDECLDTSDEEQENILSQLMQGSQEAKEAKELSLNENQTEPDTRAYAERLNYWERGLSQPDSNEIDYYHKRIATLIEKPGQHKKASTPQTGDTITLKEFKLPRRTSVEDSYFPLDRNIYCNPNFAHCRQLLRLAARYILTASADASADVENRLIRAIWHHGDLYEARYSTIVRLNLSQRGTALKTFWTHQWKNRAEAAQRLAVTRDLQLAGPSAFHGYTMANEPSVKTSNSNRNAVIRELSCGTIEWTHTPDGSKRKGKRTNSFAPTTNYVPIPGTKPPVPVFPLDETGIILGPPDEYSNYQPSAPIDEQTFKLTAASLLGRFAWALLNGKISAQQLLHKQISAMCQRLIEINKNDGVQVVAKQKNSDVALPQLYMAWMGHVSLALNGLYQRGPSNQGEEDLGGSAVVKFEKDFMDGADLNEWDTEDEEGSDMGETSLVAIASRLFDTGHKGIESSGLERFGRLHLTFGLLRIAKDVPESAAEILSRPLDDCEHRTPFEIVDHLLEHMEENNQLVEDAKAAGSTMNFVHVGELEFSFHQACKVFANCIEFDTTELDYHCWHLAILAGSLLLCSGNRIGSGAHPCPSHLLENDDQHLYDSFHGESKTLALHEVRRMLPKFHELRRETAKALQLLFQLAKHQQSSRAHLAISSFLEWRQAVALMLGPESNEEIFAAFRSIHEYHVTQWALQDLTSRHFLQVREASSATGACLEALAVQLERNPHEKARWRALAEALGPVGTPNVTSGKKCQKTKCKACWILCPGLFVDHDNETQKQQDAAWWGRDRQCWWCHSIFNFDTSHITLPYHAKILHESIAAELTPITIMETRTEQTTSSIPQPPPIDLYTSILEQALNASEESSTTASEEERCKCIDESLPSTFREEMSQELSEQYLSTTVPPLEPVAVDNGDDTDEVKIGSTADQASWDRLEVECYQVLIACHLYSTDHEWVRWKVLDLAVKCWKGWRSKAGLQRDCDEMKGLKWLYQMGISGAHAVRISIRENRRGP